jgi:hypothetical protein
MRSASKERLMGRADYFNGAGPAFRRNLFLTAAVGFAALYPVGHANAGGGTNATATTTVCKPNTSIEGGGLNCVTTTSSTTTPGPNSTAIEGGVQADIEDIREQKRKKYRAKYRAMLGYAPEATDNAHNGVLRYTTSDTKVVDPFASLGALGYASTKDSKIATKKSDAEEEAAEPDLESAVWTHGAFEHENQTGTFNGSDISLKTRSWSGLAGADWTWTLPSETYATFGVFGGQSTTYLAAPSGASATINGPTAGLYLMYFLGDYFSADVTYTHAWMINNNNNVTAVANSYVPTGGGGYVASTSIATTTALATATNMDHLEGNVNYRFNLANDWWLEPTFQASYLYLTESQGNQDEQIVHLQGGLRVGTSFTWGDVKIEPQLTGLVMSDVLVAGGGPIGGPAIETDQGQIWGKGIGKVNFNWTKSFSTSVEGQVYGTGGIENTIGYKVALEARYKW